MTTLFTVLLSLAMGVLCVFGLGLSALSLSGTWLVALAAGVGMLLPGREFPGWPTLAGMVLLCLLVEGVEALAGFWGVRRQGGSRLAGIAAIGGGLAGLVVGSFIPVPLVGSLAGMLAGSFSLVYAVEKRRLQRADHAARIAFGTVLGRIAVIFIKVGVTLAMIIWLAAGMW